MLITCGAAWPQDRDRIQPLAASGLTAQGWEVLDKGLSDSNEKHRQQVILAAGVIGPSPENVKFIGGALHDKSALVRQTVAAVFGELKSPDSMPYLRGALNDTPEVGFTAARALFEMGDQEGREFLQQVLAGERKDTPGFISKNLKYAKKKLTPAEIAMMGVREAAGVLLGPASLGIVVGEEAVKAQTSGNSGESGRTIAAASLADRPDDYTRILLEWALSDSHPEVRAAAAKGLGKCGSTETIPKLQALFNDDHAAVRYMAAASVIRLTSAAH
jgi:HEAT repeat protein